MSRIYVKKYYTDKKNIAVQTEPFDFTKVVRDIAQKQLAAIQKFNTTTVQENLKRIENENKNLKQREKILTKRLQELDEGYKKLKQDINNELANISNGIIDFKESHKSSDNKLTVTEKDKVSTIQNVNHDFDIKKVKIEIVERSPVRDDEAKTFFSTEVKTINDIRIADCFFKENKEKKEINTTNTLTEVYQQHTDANPFILQNREETTQIQESMPVLTKILKKTKVLDKNLLKESPEHPPNITRTNYYFSYKKTPLLPELQKQEKDLNSSKHSTSPNNQKIETSTTSQHISSTSMKEKSSLPSLKRKSIESSYKLDSNVPKRPYQPSKVEEDQGQSNTNQMLQSTSKHFVKNRPNLLARPDGRSNQLPEKNSNNTLNTLIASAANGWSADFNPRYISSNPNKQYYFERQYEYIDSDLKYTSPNQNREQNDQPVPSGSITSKQDRLGYISPSKNINNPPSLIKDISPREIENKIIAKAYDEDSLKHLEIRSRKTYEMVDSTALVAPSKGHLPTLKVKPLIQPSNSNTAIISVNSLPLVTTYPSFEYVKNPNANATLRNTAEFLGRDSTKPSIPDFKEKLSDVGIPSYITKQHIYEKREKIYRHDKQACEVPPPNINLFEYRPLSKQLQRPAFPHSMSSYQLFNFEQQHFIKRFNQIPPPASHFNNPYNLIINEEVLRVSNAVYPSNKETSYASTESQKINHQSVNLPNLTASIKSDNNNNITLTWDCYDLTKQLQCNVDFYSLYANPITHLRQNPPKEIDQWTCIGRVKAVQLPIICTLPQTLTKSNYFFAVLQVGRDKKIRTLSNICTLAQDC